MRLAFCFALERAGNNMAARIAMIAMTTSNSIRVNAERALSEFFEFDLDIAAIGLTTRVIVYGTCRECDDNIPHPEECLASQRYGSGQRIGMARCAVPIAERSVRRRNDCPEGAGFNIALRPLSWQTPAFVRLGKRTVFLRQYVLCSQKSVCGRAPVPAVFQR